MMNKTTEIAVQYHLPTNWEQEKAYSFDHLSEVVTLLHDSAYSATVKAVNRFATVRNYVIGYYIVEYEQHGSDRAKYGIDCSNFWQKKSTNAVSMRRCCKSVENFILLILKYILI